MRNSCTLVSFVHSFLSTVFLYFLTQNIRLQHFPPFLKFLANSYQDFSAGWARRKVRLLENKFCLKREASNWVKNKNVTKNTRTVDNSPPLWRICKDNKVLRIWIFVKSWRLYGKAEVISVRIKGKTGEKFPRFSSGRPKENLRN
jgi:hypothetical protein